MIWATGLLAAVALLLTLLTSTSPYPPGIDTAGHLFKGWAIGRGMERDLFALHGWTEFWYMGHPLYHYYPPASYFILGVIDLAITNIELTYRIFVFSTLICGGLAAYGFARQFLGGFGSTLTSLAYTLAPYTLKMIFWEGNLPRALSFVLLPLVFLFCIRLLRTGSQRNFVLLALSVAGLVFAHHMPAAATLLTLGLFVVLYGPGHARFGRQLLAGAAVVVGLALSAIWLVPAVTHNDLPEVPVLAGLPERIASYSTSPAILLDPRLQSRDADAMNGYLGLALTGLAVVALLVWPNRRAAVAFGGALALAVLLSMGVNTPLYDLVPALKNWFPERFLQPATLLLGMLAAAGVESMSQYTRIRPLIRLLLVAVFVIVLTADSSGFVRRAGGSEVRNQEQEDVSLAAEWVKENTPGRRLFVFTGRDWAVGLLPAFAGVETTAGWNPEGTPHNTSISQLNVAIASGNYRYVERTLATWDAGAAFLYTRNPAWSALAEHLEREGWQRAAVDFSGDFVLLARSDAPGARVMVNPLAGMAIGGGSGIASLIVPGFADSLGESQYVDDLDPDAVAGMRTLLLFGHQVRDPGRADAIAEAIASAGVTVIEALPTAPEHVLLGVTTETIRFSGQILVRNAEGASELPVRGVEVGPFFFNDGPWTAAAIAAGATPLLVADIDGIERVVAAAKPVGSGRIIYVGLSLFTQADIRNDPGAIRVLRLLTGDDPDVPFTPVPVNVSVRRWSGQEIRFEYELNEPVQALLSHTYFPSWTAWVDGAPAPLYRHERLTLIGLPSGKHEVRLKARWTPFQARVAWVSLAATVVLVLPWGLIGSRIRREAGSDGGRQ